LYLIPPGTCRRAAERYPSSLALMRFSVARVSLLGSLIAALMVAPAAASAATAGVDRTCYAGDGSSDIVVTGSGYTANEAVNLMIGGGIVGVTAADASGNVRTTFPVPAPPLTGKSKNDQGYAMSLVQDGLKADTTFRTARVVGDFSPSNGRPATLRVRFSAYGFGVATPAGQPMPKVYVHYVDPKRKVRRTISLGAGTAPCGTIAKTALRKLFPFNPRSGKWTLQFDTNPVYHRGTGVSRFLFYKITLTVSG
jgi:hypothetical protein